MFYKFLPTDFTRSRSYIQHTLENYGIDILNPRLTALSTSSELSILPRISRVNLGEEALEQYRASTPELLEEEVEEQKEVNPYISKCRNKTSAITLEPFTSTAKIASFVFPSPDNRVITECYDVLELNQFLNSSSKVYLWKIDPAKPNWVGKPNPQYPVFKLPLSGVWVANTNYY